MTSKQRKAKEEHEKWLKSKGLHLSQLEKKSNNTNKIPSYKTESNYNSSNTIPTWEPGTYKKSPLDNLKNENANTQAQILEKMSRIQPAFNKGGLQLIAKKDLKVAGKK